MVLSAALAHADSGDLLQEVTVTAQKREQSINDVGVSVTAFSGEQMKALNITDTLDIAQQTPGLSVTGYGGGATTTFAVRGAGQLDFDDQQEAPVAVYVDGAYISFIAGVGFNFFDLDHVEVLRGAQGTLFGRNATAGVVQILSQKPVDHEDGYVEVTGGNYGDERVEAAFNEPLTNNLWARFSFYHETRSGYVENSTGPNGGNVNDNSGRLQFLYKPDDSLSVLLALRFGLDSTAGQAWNVHAAVTDENGLVQLVQPYGPITPAYYQAYCAALSATYFVTPPAGGVKPTSGDCYNASPNVHSPYRISTDAPSYFKRRTYESTLTVDYKIGLGTLTSITDFQDFHKNYADDSDGTPLDLFTTSEQRVDATQVSEELRYASETSWGRYIGGAYLLQIRNDGVGAIDAANTLGIGWINDYPLLTTTYAGFSQVEYNFSPTVTGIVGGRWTEDLKRYQIDVGCAYTTFPITPSAADCLVLAPDVQGTGLPVTTRREGNWSGNVELDWKPEEGQLVYGKVVRGYKAGGFNGGLSNLYTTAQSQYGAEKPLTYEIGSKTEFLDHKARLNFDLYRTEYRDFQTFTAIGPSILVFNVNARMTGSELELVLNPAEGWDVLFGSAWLDAYQMSVPGPGGNLDRPMPNSPRFTFNALARYHWPMFGGSMAVQVDGNYVWEHSVAAVDQPALQINGYALLNGEIGWTTQDKKWGIKAWIRNIADREYYTNKIDISTISGQIEEVVGMPRTFGGTISYHF